MRKFFYFRGKIMKISKLFLVTILTVIFAFSVISFTACNTDDGKLEVSDDEYTLTLKGLYRIDDSIAGDDKTVALPDVVITKKQVKELYKTKPVNYTSNDPAYASDKTDDDGNLIPHSLKGVYLEDLMAKYSDSMAISEYGSLTLNAADGYVTVATSEVFDSHNGAHGSKMIIAFEYDGVSLNAKERSGALRAVFPNQIANVWAKKLTVIEFSKEILTTPAVYEFSVFEALDVSDYGGGYEADKVTGNGTYHYTYSGIQISKLIGVDKVLKGITGADKMCVFGWDYNDATDKYTEYKVWTKYDVFNNGYILTSGVKDDDSASTLTRTPVFDGPDFGAGMTVKNLLSLSVFHSAVVVMDTAMTRWDPNADGDADGKFSVRDLLTHLNMYDDDNAYVITKPNGDTLSLTYAQITAAKVGKNATSGKYELHYDTNATIEFAKIGIVMD